VFIDAHPAFLVFIDVRSSSILSIHTLPNSLWSMSTISFILNGRWPLYVDIFFCSRSLTFDLFS